jgi:hypothetical protein
VIVHLIDGTYELFRQFYGQRRFNEGEDRPCGAVRGVLHSVLEGLERARKVAANGPRPRTRPGWTVGRTPGERA